MWWNNYVVATTHHKFCFRRPHARVVLPHTADLRIEVQVLINLLKRPASIHCIELWMNRRIEVLILSLAHDEVEWVVCMHAHRFDTKLGHCTQEGRGSKYRKYNGDFFHRITEMSIGWLRSVSGLSTAS